MANADFDYIVGAGSAGFALGSRVAVGDIDDVLRDVALLPHVLAQQIRRTEEP